MIGSDDVYLPDKLAVQVPLLRDAPPEVGVIFGPVELIGPQGEPLPTPKWPVISEGSVFVPLLRQNFVSAMGTLVRRSCYDKVGLYDESLVYEDLDMWLRIAKQYQFKYSEQISAKYRVHPKSAMQSRQAVLIESTLRLLHKYWGESAETDQIIMAHAKNLSERLYQLGSPRAKHWLHLRWRRERGVRTGILYMLALLGVPGTQVVKLQRRLGR
ncbi:hypothetical protein EWM57_20670 [Hymenobacter persicinus]|uniref:Glycosyltransferase n=1 Tax=Hymenobacter persicinus TaxID=2025506 RepID=A0A4Q5L865_9BACT|nr:hypothetical protein EWM57_20670 [Hymenobacter persicinus]